MSKSVGEALIEALREGTMREEYCDGESALMYRAYRRDREAAEARKRRFLILCSLAERKQSYIIDSNTVVQDGYWREIAWLICESAVTDINLDNGFELVITPLGLDLLDQMVAEGK